jgi:ABC-type polysaccharide/polyol phosphate transport system ATPase subunit
VTVNAIEVRELRKAFRLPHERRDTLLEYVLSPLKRVEYERNVALDGVSFAVEKGECLGIIGPNGGGKSTLLKLLAGIYPADGGDVVVRGRLSPFIELGVGFNLELTGRDNVRINATLLGLSKRELDRRFDSIVEFAELERFVDQKLKNYSSGMLVRLAYSIAIQVDFDVLLLDEVLAVGDRAFQEKSFRTFERFRTEGKTIVFVSHDLEAVIRSCDRALLVQSGRVAALGPTREVVERYAQSAPASAGVRLRNVSSAAGGER